MGRCRPAQFAGQEVPEIAVGGVSNLGRGGQFKGQFRWGVETPDGSAKEPGTLIGAAIGSALCGTSVDLTNRGHLPALGREAQTVAIPRK